MAKANVLTSDRTVTFEFSTGETIQASLDDLAPGVVERLALHGLEQKIRDAYAGADFKEAAGLAQKVWDNLKSGIWGRVPRPKGVPLLVRAVAMVLQERGKPVPENLAETIEALSVGDKIKLRRDPAVAAAIARLKPQSEDILESLIS